MCIFHHVLLSQYLDGVILNICSGEHLLFDDIYIAFHTFQSFPFSIFEHSWEVNKT